ncbi:hypothetical protein F4554_003763 [Actinopolymorpha rutila]|uniref:Uncharacterized protein n=1 Tax=Actinopolymorpha rutila TaxID=446787 RepID=A0A852ZG31_9ACTN|nr:hypothetical protein [Actinopolymorpha rutila]
MVRNHNHVHALEQAAIAATTAPPHRRKQCIPPGPAARAAATILCGQHATASTHGSDVVVDLAAYSAPVAARTSVPRPPSRGPNTPHRRGKPLIQPQPRADQHPQQPAQPASTNSSMRPPGNAESAHRRRSPCPPCLRPPPAKAHRHRLAGTAPTGHRGLRHPSPWAGRSATVRLPAHPSYLRSRAGQSLQANQGDSQPVPSSACAISVETDHEPLGWSSRRKVVGAEEVRPAGEPRTVSRRVYLTPGRRDHGVGRSSPGGPPLASYWCERPRCYGPRRHLRREIPLRPGRENRNPVDFPYTDTTPIPGTGPPGGRSPLCQPL